MSKRSHDIASRQAEISRERKRKKKAQGADKRGVSSTPAEPFEGTDTTSASQVMESSSGYVSPQPAQSIRADDPRYHYVYRDIKTIGRIAAPLVVILIILAFVL